jgi:hypothetical protein
MEIIRQEENSLDFQWLELTSNVTGAMIDGAGIVPRPPLIEISFILGQYFKDSKLSES